MARRPLVFGLGVGGIITVIVLAMIAGAVSTAYTSSSTFCANCHEMTTRYVSWTRSTHAAVECMDCHAGVGLTGYIKAKLGGLQQAWQHNFGEIGNIVAHVEDPVCMKCHYFSKDPQYSHDPQFGNDRLFVPSKLHQAHFADADSICTACHVGMVHGSVVTGGVPIKQRVCDECHVRKKVYVEAKL